VTELVAPRRQEQPLLRLGIRLVGPQFARKLGTLFVSEAHTEDERRDEQKLAAFATDLVLCKARRQLSA